MRPERGGNMKVLLTGGFGNIGHETIKHLLKQGHNVRCLDLDTKAKRQAAKEFKGRVEVVWGDVTSRSDVDAAVKGQDAVVHLANYVDIMWMEAHPEEARKVNVGGTVNVIEAVKAGLSQGRKLVYISSIGVWGSTRRPLPGLKASDPVSPLTLYGRQKVECEETVKNSGLDWCILRLAVAPPMKGDRIETAAVLFEAPLDAHWDFVDPRDVGLAVANSVTSSEVWQKTLLIGGGSRNQMLYRDFIKTFFGFLGPIPEEAFAPPDSPMWAEWVDSSESQHLLNYQNHTLQEFVEEMLATMAPGWRRRLIPLAAPSVRRQLLKQSRYYKAAKQRAAHQAA
jgi:UDP-glucose 4-epimerase